MNAGIPGRGPTLTEKTAAGQQADNHLRQQRRYRDGDLEGVTATHRDTTVSRCIPRAKIPSGFSGQSDAQDNNTRRFTCTLDDIPGDLSNGQS